MRGDGVRGAAVAALVLAVVAAAVAYEAARVPREVRMYCAYGAVSKAQRDGCEDRITEDDVASRNTNAARWARGDLLECLADAGPFCSERGNPFRYEKPSF